MESDPNNELLIVNIRVGTICTNIITVYRTTAMDTNRNIEFVDAVRSKIENEINFVIIGNLIYPGIDWEALSSNCGSERYFLDLVNENHLHQHVFSATRGNNILDIVLSSELDLISNVQIGSTFSTSDHNYVTCNLNLFKPAKNEKLVPNFSRADWETIRLYLATIDWEEELANKDANAMCNIFNEKIHFAIENFVPKISPKNQIAGYSNNEIKQLIRQKNRKWQKYKRDRTSRNKNEYNRFTKYVSRRVREIKGKYERNIFQGKTKSLKFFYNYVKNITGNKSDSDIPDLVVNQFSFTSDYQKALVLADQYRSVYQTDNGTIPFSHQQMPEDSFCDITVTDEDVVMAIRQMNSNSAPGDDGIPAQFIKNLSCYLIKPLHTIFQESFRSGVVPSAWRIGITIPIYKRNRKPEDPASYRPVCLTSVVGKLAERVFLSVFTNYIQENFLISNSQHAFISGKSTATNLIECINEWTKKN